MEDEKKVQWFSQTGDFSSSIPDCNRERADQFGRAYENRETRGSGRRHGPSGFMNQNGRGEPERRSYAPLTLVGPLSLAKAFFVSVGAVSSIGVISLGSLEKICRDIYPMDRTKHSLHAK